MEIKDMILVLQAAERGEEIVEPCGRTFDVVGWLRDNVRLSIKPKPRMVPLGTEDVPPGSFVRNSHEHERYWYSVLAVHDCGITTSRDEGYLSYTQLRDFFWLISRDGGRTWERCEKEAK